MTLPDLPDPHENPWYAKRQAFDQAVKDELENRLSPDELSATFAPQRTVRAAKGAAVVFFDDGKNQFYNEWLPLAEQYGHKINFPIFSDWHAAPGTEWTNHMSWAQLRALVNRGHEVLNHSKTHSDMTTMTASQRLAEWDTSQSFIATQIGIASSQVRNFAYPFSKHTTVIDAEAYLRWQRVFTGDSAPFVIPISERHQQFVVGRATWAAGYEHSRCLELIRRAASEPVIVSMITHYDPAGGTAQAATTAQVAELFQLAADLGVPLLTASEAFGGYLPVSDAGFEDINMKSWTTIVGSGESAVSAAIAPMVGLNGSRALKISSTGGAGYPYALTSQPIPILRGEQHTLSAKIKQDKTSGSYGGYIFVREYDLYGATIGDTNSAYVTSTVDWQTISVAYTPSATARSVRLGFAQRQIVGDTYYDHVHFGPTRFGVLG